MVGTSPQSTAEIVLQVKELLAETPIGDIAAHRQLKSVIPVNLLGRYGIYVRRAQDLLNQELGAVFEVVKGQGYRRLGSVNGVEYAKKKPMLKIRRTVRRGLKVLRNSTHHANDLTREQRLQAVTVETRLQLIDQITRAKIEIPPPEQDDLKRPSDPQEQLKSMLLG